MAVQDKLKQIKGFSFDATIKPLLELAWSNKNIVVGIVGVSLVTYTMFNTLTKLETEKDQAHFQQLESSVITTRFDQDIISKIRQLDDFQESIDSNFINDRNNPFVENSDSGFQDQKRSEAEEAAALQERIAAEEIAKAREENDAKKTPEDEPQQKDLNAIQTRLEVFYTDNGRYPNLSEITLEGLSATENLAAESLIDPFGNTVQAGTDPGDGGYYYDGIPSGCEASSQDCAGFILSTTNPATSYNITEIGLNNPIAESSAEKQASDTRDSTSNSQSTQTTGTAIELSSMTLSAKDSSSGFWFFKSNKATVDWSVTDESNNSNLQLILIATKDSQPTLDNPDEANNISTTLTGTSGTTELELIDNSSEYNFMICGKNALVLNFECDAQSAVVKISS